MASIVTLKTDGLSEAAAKAAALKTDMDSIYAQLQKLENRLGENISALQNSTQTAQNLVFSSQKKGLSAQATRMNSVVSLLNTASGETTNSTNKLTNSSRQLQLSVGTMSASSVAATTVAGVTASSLAITSVFGGNWASSFWTSLTDWIVGIGQTVGEKIVAAEKEAQRIQSIKSEEQLLDEMRARYQRTLKKVNQTSFNFQCSKFTWRQLEDLGVFVYGKDPGCGNGADYYATWSKKSQTSTGYQVESCGGESGLKDLIAKHPGETLQNIVVSFDYRSKLYGYIDEDGTKIGHVLLITEIRDGKVYFMESADGNLWSQKGRPAYKEGEPLCLTVDQFSKQYPYMNGAVRFYK